MLGKKHAVAKHSILTGQLKTEKVWDISLTCPNTEHEGEWGIHNHIKEYM